MSECREGEEDNEWVGETVSEGVEWRQRVYGWSGDSDCMGGETGCRCGEREGVCRGGKGVEKNKQKTKGQNYKEHRENKREEASVI